MNFMAVEGEESREECIVYFPQTPVLTLGCSGRVDECRR
jgi:hypothetical protein